MKEIYVKFLKKGEIFPILIQDPVEPTYTTVSNARDLETLRLIYQHCAADNWAKGYERIAKMYDEGAECCLDLERLLGRCRGGK